MHNYAALCAHFQQLSENSPRAQEKATYRGMTEKMTTIEFFEDFRLINTCLAELCELLDALQRRDMNPVITSKQLLVSKLYGPSIHFVI